MPTAAAVPPQIGNPKIVKGAPYFKGYTVLEDTWKEKDATQMLLTRDGDSNVDNYTFWSPGVDASCDVAIQKTADPVTAPLTIGQVITETQKDGTALESGARSFIVVDAETSTYGGKPLKQSLKLAYWVGFTPTVNDD